MRSSALLNRPNANHSELKNANQMKSDVIPTNVTDTNAAFIMAIKMNGLFQPLCKSQGITCIYAATVTRVFFPVIHSGNAVSYSTGNTLGTSSFSPCGFIQGSR